MENCEAMTSSTHSFAYSYRLVKKCFLKICETSKCHNFLIFQPIFIRFSLFCSKLFTLSSEIKLNLLWISSLRLSLSCMSKLSFLKCPLQMTITLSETPARFKFLTQRVNWTKYCVMECKLQNSCKPNYKKILQFLNLLSYENTLKDYKLWWGWETQIT